MRFFHRKPAEERPSVSSLDQLEPQIGDVANLRIGAETTGADFLDNLKYVEPNRGMYLSKVMDIIEFGSRYKGALFHHSLRHPKEGVTEELALVRDYIRESEHPTLYDALCILEGAYATRTEDGSPIELEDAVQLFLMDLIDEGRFEGVTFSVAQHNEFVTATEEGIFRELDDLEQGYS